MRVFTPAEGSGRPTRMVGQMGLLGSEMRAADRFTQALEHEYVGWCSHTSGGARWNVGRLSFCGFWEAPL
jgi:hypothetical protein